MIEGFQLVEFIDWWETWYKDVDRLEDSCLSAVGMMRVNIIITITIIIIIIIIIIISMYSWAEGSHGTKKLMSRFAQSFNLEVFKWVWFRWVDWNSLHDVISLRSNIHTI